MLVETFWVPFKTFLMRCGTVELLQFYLEFKGAVHTKMNARYVSTYPEWCLSIQIVSVESLKPKGHEIRHPASNNIVLNYCFYLSLIQGVVLL